MIAGFPGRLEHLARRAAATRSPRGSASGDGAERQTPPRDCIDALAIRGARARHAVPHALGRQPAEGRAGAVAVPRSQASWSSTIPRAASMPAPRRRSTAILRALDRPRRRDRPDHRRAARADRAVEPHRRSCSTAGSRRSIEAPAAAKPTERQLIELMLEARRCRRRAPGCGVARRPAPLSRARAARAGEARGRRPIALGFGDVAADRGRRCARRCSSRSPRDAFLTLRNCTGISGQASTLLLACLGASFVDPDGQHRPVGRRDRAAGRRGDRAGC